MRRVWTGSWEVHHTFADESVLHFRTTPEWSQTRPDGCGWTTEDGHLLARTGGNGGTTLVFEQGMDRKMLHLLVTCWIAKLWSEALTMRTSLA
jgi:hypothetical protein